MKTFHMVTGLLAIVVFCWSCQTKRAETGTVSTDSTQRMTDSATAATSAVDTVGEASANDCVRAEPEPIITKGNCPGKIFQKKPDGTAIEATILNQGDSLIIHHTGCEYYWLSFRFETSRFQADTTDIPFWMDKAMILMREINPALEPGID